MASFVIMSAAMTFSQLSESITKEHTLPLIVQRDWKRRFPCGNWESECGAKQERRTTKRWPVSG